MTVTVRIETNTITGKKLITELRRYPEVVQFLEPDQLSEPVPEGYVPVIAGSENVKKILINSNTETGKKLIYKLESHPRIAKLEYPYPTEDSGMDMESISASDSAKLAFNRLGEKYNRKFNNKYTR
jgi:hypothetical protein